MLATLLVQAACEPAADPVEVVRGFLEAHRANRPAALLDVLTDDATIESSDGRRVQGREALRALFQWDSAVAREIAIEEFDVRGDTVRAGALVERSVWLWLLGIERLVRRPGTTFLVRDSRITEIRFAALEPESRVMLDRALADFLPWAEHEYPDRLHRVRPQGRFAFGARPAADWLLLLREWRSGER
jgi:hypothetical protein